MHRIVLALAAGAVVVLLVALFVWLRPREQPHEAPPTAVLTEPAIQVIRIDHGQRVAGPEVIQVRQGETLKVQFVSNQAVELHLHGYDRHLQLSAGKPAMLTLQAEHSGRFEYELHGHGAGAHNVLGVIEVQPR